MNTLNQNNLKYTGLKKEAVERIIDLLTKTEDTTYIDIYDYDWEYAFEVIYENQAIEMMEGNIWDIAEALEIISNDAGVLSDFLDYCKSSYARLISGVLETLGSEVYHELLNKYEEETGIALYELEIEEGETLNNFIQFIESTIE